MHMLLITDLSGKSDVAKSLVEKMPSQYGMVLSSTSRPKNPEELEGEEYNFVEQSEFHKLRDRDGFLEYQDFEGHMYGIAKSDITSVAKNNLIPVLTIDVDGFLDILERNLNVASFLITPLTEEELSNQIESRGFSGKALKARLTKALDDLCFAEKYDFVIAGNSFEENFRKLIENLSFLSNPDVNAKMKTISKIQKGFPNLKISA